MATITIRQAEREELERLRRQHEEMVARLSADDRRRVAEQRLPQIAAMFATE
jgi:hypothetical protein